MLHFLHAAVLMTLVITARAGGENSYRGDSIVTAELAFRSIFSLSYLVLAGLCLLVLVKKPGRAPKVYFTLFLATLFRGISTIATVFNLVISQDGIEMSSSAVAHTYVALTALISFLIFWSFGLFFLSTCLLVRDRLFSFHKVSDRSNAPTVYYTIFALIMVFATVTASYDVAVNAIAYLNTSHVSFEEGVHMENISNSLSYPFASLIFSASFFPALYIIYAHRELRRLLSRDKIVEILLVVIAPQYVLYALQGIITTVLTSPAGLTLSGFGPTVIRAEKVSLASAILTHISLICIGFTTVVVGLFRHPWHLGVDGESSPVTGPYDTSKRRSVEFERHA